MCSQGTPCHGSRPASSQPCAHSAPIVTSCISLMKLSVPGRPNPISLAEIFGEMDLLQRDRPSPLSVTVIPIDMLTNYFLHVVSGGDRTRRMEMHIPGHKSAFPVDNPGNVQSAMHALALMFATFDKPRQVVIEIKERFTTPSGGPKPPRGGAA